MRQQIIKNTWLSGVAVLTSALVGFFLLPFLVNSLGILAYGAYAVCNLFVIGGYIGVFELGAGAGLIKFSAQYKAERRFDDLQSLAASFFYIFIFIGFILSIGGWVASFLIDGSIMKISPSHRHMVVSGVRIVFTFYLILFPQVILNSIIEGLQEFKFLKYQQVAGTIVSALGIVLLLSYDKNFVFVIFWQQAVAGVLTVSSFIFLKRQGLDFSVRLISIGKLKEVYHFSKYVLGGRVSSIAYNETDKVLIGTILGAAFITYYDLVMRLPRVLKSILGIGNSVVLPVASEIQARTEKRKLRELFLRGIRINVFFSLPVLTFFIFYSEPFLSLWSSSQYNFLVTPLRWMLCWCYISLFIGFGNSIMMAMNERMGALTLHSWSIMIIKIILSLILMKEFGILAFAFAQFISLFVTLPWFFNVLFKDLGIKAWKFIGQNIFAIAISIIPGLIGFCLDKLILTQGVAGLVFAGFIWVGLYSLLMYKFCLSKRDQHTLFEVAKIGFAVFGVRLGKNR